MGRGYARKLEKYGLRTMGDIALCSLGGPEDYYNEDLLYKLFGINAELLIDHAWGWESCTLSQIKAYQPASRSLSSGQVLSCPYSVEKARVIVGEMLDLLALDLVEKGLQTDQIVLTIGYDRESLTNPAISYAGPVVADPYGRAVPKSATGSADLGGYTSSTRRILERVLQLFDRITDPSLLVRRVTVAANHVLSRQLVPQDGEGEQLDLFAPQQEQEHRRQREQRELRRQEAVLRIQHKYGKNAILKGMNFREGATTIARNGQVGGHKR